MNWYLKTIGLLTALACMFRSCAQAIIVVLIGLRGISGAVRVNEPGLS